MLFVAEGLGRTADGAVMQFAASQNRLLLTEDKDFGRLALDRGPVAAGVMLVRMPDPDVQTKIERIRAVLADRVDDLRTR